MTASGERIKDVIALIALIGILLALIPAFAQTQNTEEESGYSLTELQQLKAVKETDSKKATSAKDQPTCFGFEAEFSDPLQEKPNAFLDIEVLHRIKGIIPMILEVLPMTPKKYRLQMKTDPEVCEGLKANGDDVSVTVDGAVGQDGRPVLPDQRTFRLGKDF